MGCYKLKDWDRSWLLEFVFVYFQVFLLLSDYEVLLNSHLFKLTDHLIQVFDLFHSYFLFVEVADSHLVEISQQLVPPLCQFLDQSVECGYDGMFCSGEWVGIEARLALCKTGRHCLLLIVLFSRIIIFY